MSLVDYPGKIALTLFTSGCNFDCAYCHNPELKSFGKDDIDESTVFEYIEKRRRLIDGVVITGGEPSLHGEMLLKFMERLKELYPEKAIKLDTNGSKPCFVGRAMEFVDFIAMDLKGTDYSRFSGIPMEIVEETLGIVSSFKDHEVRITVYPPYVRKEDLPGFVKLLKGISNVAVQQYRPVDDVLPYSNDLLREFARSFEDYGFSVTLRL